MRGFFDFFWPTIGKPSAGFLKEQNDSDEADIEAIRATNWHEGHALALEEARSFASNEKDRRVSAETKASIYLAAIAAIVPIGLPLCTAFFAETFPKQELWLQILTLSLFSAGVGYILGAAWWSFRTFKVAVHHRLDATDYVHIWADANRKSLLVSELLIVTRLNRHMVNWKTSCVRQAHEFLLRSLMAFTALLLVIVAWEPISKLAKRLAELTS
jgi:hypothetical protein